MNSKTDRKKEERRLVYNLLNGGADVRLRKLKYPGYCLEWAKTNGVLFLLLLCIKRGRPDVIEKERINSLYHEQRRLARQMAEAAHELIGLFQGMGVRLLPIKTFLQFPYVDHDLDIVIVDYDCSLNYRKTLLGNGYTYLKSRSSLREPKKRFFLPENDKTKRLRVHIHFALSWNGVDYLNAEKVWERRRTITTENVEIPIPSVEDEILIMAAHAVHENKYVLLEEMLQLRELTKSGRIDWPYIIASAEKYNWLPGLYLFFTIANEIMGNLSQRNPIPEKVMRDLASEDTTCGLISRYVSFRRGATTISGFPVIMPFFLTSATFFYKFIKDLKSKRTGELVREFVSYSIVDLAVFLRFKVDMARLSGTDEGAR